MSNFLYTLFVLMVAMVAFTFSQIMCRSSNQCGTSSCCRDSNGNVISDQHMFGGGPAFNSGGGNCSMKMAMKGEICDSNCHCDVGLECYRPVSGVCCPPSRCYDTTYVQQQKAYWANCLADPTCGYPP